MSVVFTNLVTQDGIIRFKVKCDLCGQFMSPEYGFFRVDIYGRISKDSESAHCCCRCYENKMTDYEQNRWETIL